MRSTNVCKTFICFSFSKVSTYTTASCRQDLTSPRYLGLGELLLRVVCRTDPCFHSNPSWRCSYRRMTRNELRKRQSFLYSLISSRHNGKSMLPSWAGPRSQIHGQNPFCISLFAFISSLSSSRALWHGLVVTECNLYPAEIKLTSVVFASKGYTSEVNQFRRFCLRFLT